MFVIDNRTSLFIAISLVLCNGSISHCSSSKKLTYAIACSTRLRILIVVPKDLMPSQMGCDKRVFYILEELQGLRQRSYVLCLSRTSNIRNDDDSRILARLHTVIDNRTLVPVIDDIEKTKDRYRYTG